MKICSISIIYHNTYINIYCCVETAVRSYVSNNCNTAEQQRTSRRQQHCRVLSIKSLWKQHYPESNTCGRYCFSAASEQVYILLVLQGERRTPWECVQALDQTEAQAHTLIVNIISVLETHTVGWRNVSLVPSPRPSWLSAKTTQSLVYILFVE